MKNIFLLLIGLFTTHLAVAQIGVRYDNEELTNYSSAMKSSDFTYLIWDRNTAGEGLFATSTKPTFMYWDNDEKKIGYLIDTQNMTELKAGFHSLHVQSNVGIGLSSAVDGKLHVYNNATTGGWGSTFDELKTNAVIRIQDSGSSMYLDGNTIFTTGNTHIGPQSNHYLTLGTNGSERVRVDQEGNVGIGTTTPDAKLTVKGDIHAERVQVDLNFAAPDYVFEADYELRSLEETADFIKANKHLPEIPSAKELEANGVDLVEMNMLLLKKIEELTLHVIDLQNQINQNSK